jgi:hypothetical protein
MSERIDAGGLHVSVIREISSILYFEILHATSVAAVPS